MDAPPPAPFSGSAGPASGAYRVLARKYRPASFDDLIGQEPMVRTLSNAFAAGRIPQAWMLTGVRGVGKTTTARILARALNYVLPGEIDRPTIDLTRPGLHCQAIMEGRHVDVIEMDAASHTGIDDIREINEAARYKPATARYKVFIIDEVHMLSTAAFNGLLKTLEEPPEHVKFVFATTEIRKVPVTVLSRCQRFDLRRIEADVLVGHLGRICGLESITAEPAALALIARAAEGSVRDSLSLLDQAIAHGSGDVRAEDVRLMLGLADKARIVDLFEHVMKGDAAAALAELSDQHAVGADPAVVLTDLAAFVHLVTRLKLVPAAARDRALTESEVARGQDFAGKLSIPALSRAWSMLLKAIPEVQSAARPLAAAEMALVRLAYSADLPTPDEALRALKAAELMNARGGAPRGNGGGGGGATAMAVGAPMGGGMPVPGGPVGRPVLQAVPGSGVRAEPVVARMPAVRLASLADVAALATEKRDIRMRVAVERYLRPVGFQPGHIEVEPTAEAPPEIAGDLGRKLTDWTGTRWIVSLAPSGGGPTLAEENARLAAERREDAEHDPMVMAVLARFPGAEIVDVRILEAETGPDPAPDEDSLAMTDPEDPGPGFGDDEF